MSSLFSPYSLKAVTFATVLSPPRCARRQATSGWSRIRPIHECFSWGQTPFDG
jgi:hypothetical protein